MTAAAALAAMARVRSWWRGEPDEIGQAIAAATADTTAVLDRMKGHAVNLNVEKCPALHPGTYAVCSYPFRHAGRHSWESAAEYTARMLPDYAPHRDPLGHNPARAYFWRTVVGIAVIVGLLAAGCLNGYPEALGADAKPSPGYVTKAEARATEAGETRGHLRKRTGTRVVELWHRDGWRDYVSTRNWIALRVEYRGHPDHPTGRSRVGRAFLITCHPFEGPDTDWTCTRERVA